MALADLLTAGRTWIDTITPIATGVLGWFGSRMQARLTAQRNAVDAQALETKRIELSLERERDLSTRVIQAMKEARYNWKLLYEREAVLIQYHAAAIGARLAVHDLELQAGKQPTAFEPLPGYPPPPVSTADHEAVDQAASPADPGAQTPIGIDAKAAL